VALKKKRLGDLLVEAGIIDKLQLRAALGQQASWGKTLGRTLLEMRLITEEQLVPILAEQLNMPAINLARQGIDLQAVAMLDEEFCRENECIPFKYHEQNKFLDVAMTDAQSAGLFDRIRVRTRCNVHPFLAGPEAVRNAIDRAYGEDIAEVRPQFMLTDNIVDFEEQPDRGKAAQPAEPRGRRKSVVVAVGDEAAPPLQEEAPAVTQREMIQVRRHIVALREHIRRQDQQLRVLAAQLKALTQRHEAPGEPTIDLELEEPVQAHAAAAAPEPTVTELMPLETVSPHKDSMEIDVDVIFEGVDLEGEPGDTEPATTPNDDAAPAPTPAEAVSAPQPEGEALPLVDVPPDSPTVVAMDLGTTRSSVAAVVDGRVSVLKLPGGEWDMPSVVGFRKDGSVMLGEAARKMLATDPDHAIASPKRLMGRRFDEPSLQPYIARLGMKAAAGPRDEVMLEVHDKTITVVEACAHILNLLRLIAEKNLGHDVREVILTTPVSFTDRQHAALTEAAELADLRVLELVDEPVAATLACVSDPMCKGLVAVFDFGGGTFDFSVVDVGSERMEVITSAGDTWLGGDDFDEVLAKAAADAFWRSTEIELRNQAYQWQRLLVRAEQTKRALSERDRDTLKLPGAALTSEGTLDLEFPITRSRFAVLCEEIIQRALVTCREALELNDLKVGDLSAVYLSGGTTYIPAVQTAVAAFFGKQPRVVVPPERAVLIGAAVHGALYPQEVARRAEEGADG
jgi:hypothetical protein